MTKYNSSSVQIRQNKAEARERRARKYETDDEKQARFQDMAAEDEITQVGEFIDGRKRYSLHLKEFKGSSFIAIKKQYLNGKTGQWQHKQLLTFSPEDAAEMLELVAQAANLAGDMGTEETEEDGTTYQEVN